MMGSRNLEKERRTIFAVISLGLILLLLQFYRWEIIDVITPFLQWPFEMAVYGFYFLALIIIFILGIRDLRRGRKVRLGASVFMVAIYGITLVVNFTGLWIDYYFRKYKGQRIEVINMIESGQLKPNISHDRSQIHLPVPFDKTSMGGGDIIQDFSSANKQAFFYSFRGILDSYAGFYYSSDDVPPEQNSLGLEFRDSIKLEKNWYWIGTCNKGKNDALGALLDLAPILRC